MNASVSEGSTRCRWSSTLGPILSRTVFDARVNAYPTHAVELTHTPELNAYRNAPSVGGAAIQTGRRWPRAVVDRG